MLKIRIVNAHSLFQLFKNAAYGTLSVKLVLVKCMSITF